MHDSDLPTCLLIRCARTRISFLDIKIAILELNEDILDQETVEKMVPNCPEPTDIATVMRASKM